jgi:tetratricopeptide (TPR) repeat protein
LWAATYDRDLKEIFEMQDEITKKILTELHVKLLDGESARTYSKGTENLQAYLKVLEANHYRLRGNKADNAVAKRLCQEALAIDPTYPAAYMSLAHALVVDYLLDDSESHKDTLLNAMKKAQRALELDKSSAEAHGRLSSIFLFLRQHDKAIALGERALALGPNDPKALLFLSLSLNYAGRPEEAYPLLQKGIRINPLYHPLYYQLGISCSLTGRYEEGIEAAKKALQLSPKNMLAYRILTSIYLKAGREDDARAAAAEVLKRDPRHSFVEAAKRTPFKDRAVVKRYIELYRKAGLK